MSNIAGSASVTFGNASAVNEAMLTTGSTSRAVSTIERELGMKFDETKNYTEGSYVQYNNLEPGLYKVTFQFESLDKINPDGIIFVQNNSVFIKMPDNDEILESKTLAETMPEPSTEFSTVFEIPYGNLTIIILDSTDKLNTSAVKITEMIRTGNLSFPVPEAVDLTSADIIGDFSQSAEELELRTGTGSRAVSSIGRHLGFTLEIETATESTVAKFNESFGRYKIYYELETYEPAGSAKDQFYVWNGREFWPIADTSQAITSVTDARNTTGIKTAEFDVYDGLGLFIIDTVDSTKTSTVKIYKLDQVASFSQMEFPAHKTVLQMPLDMADKALIAYKTQSNYTLDNWNNDWQIPYNWYWHQMDDTGQDSNLLNEEVQKMNFETVIFENDKFREAFFGTWNVPAHTLRQLFLENPDDSTEIQGLSVLNTLAAITPAIAVIRLHYELASEIGLRNNIEQSILDEIIPAFYTKLTNLINHAMYYDSSGQAKVIPLEWIISMIYSLASQDFRLEKNIQYNGFNEIYQLWRNSWGMD